MIFHVASSFFRKMGKLYELSEKHYKTGDNFPRPGNVKEIVLDPEELARK